MAQVTVKHEGDMRCVSTCGGFSNQIITDGPKIIGGKEENISPTDLLGMALGGCILTMMGMAAKQMKIDFSGAEVKVEKSFAGGKISALKVDVYYTGDLEEAERERLMKAAHSCPVHHVLRTDIAADIHFHFAAQAGL